MSKVSDLASSTDFQGAVASGTTIGEFMAIPGWPHSIDVTKRAHLRVRRLIDATDDENEPIPAESSTNPPPSADYVEALRKTLKKGTAYTIEGLADTLDVSPKRIREGIERLQAQHYLVDEEDGQVVHRKHIDAGGRSVIDVPRLYGSDSWVRFGVISDNHAGSRYERCDVTNALYDVFQMEGLSTVYHTGNWIEGESSFNKQDVKVHGFEDQINHFLRTYPRREGITTHVIAGDDHEGWYVQREGVDVGKRMEQSAREAGRDDLVYLGYMEHDIVLQGEEGDCSLRLCHPGGGTGYAISYSPQRWVESLTGGEKPAIAVLGHWHKSEYIFYRNVHVVQAGCSTDQSTFMRKKRLAAHIGGWIIEAHQAPDGSINRFKQEWLPFFNREYYQIPWSYKMTAHD